MPYRSIALLLAAVLFPIVSGCSDSNRGTVSGTVTIDSQPVKAGSIAFFPVDEKSPTSGATIADGQYTATVALGPAIVQIRVAKVVGQKKLYNTPDSPMMPIMHEVLPPKYNDASELRFDVKPGSNVKNFELSAK
jgi:hypothetical protein